MRDSPEKRDMIVRAAMGVFAEHGYEGATLAMVKASSGMSVGSIVNFFGDKAGLAAAVYAEAANSLISEIEAVLSRDAVELRETIRSLLSACLNWERGSPKHPRALAVLSGVIATSARHHDLEFSTRLASILAAWAKPLVSAGAVAPLSPCQIYAVILGQAMSAMMLPDPGTTDSGHGSVDWLDTLVGSAVHGLAVWTPIVEPQLEKLSKPARRRSSSARRNAEGQGGLFDQ